MSAIFVEKIPSDSKDGIFFTEFPTTTWTRFSGCKVIWSLDDTGVEKWGKLKHVSMSREFDLPTWRQVVEVKNRWFGDVDCMMILPKLEDYVNLHAFCFHLWETPQPWELR